MLNAYYPPALVAASVISLDNKEFRMAHLYSGAAMAHSASNQTFPHVIHADAMYAYKFKELATHEYMIAALLGDNNAESTGVAVAENKIILAMGMKSAYSYLLRNFGSNFPVDTRPQRVYVNQEDEI